jgi:hypothetical protein
MGKDLSTGTQAAPQAGGLADCSLRLHLSAATFPLGTQAASCNLTLKDPTFASFVRRMHRSIPKLAAASQ